MIKFAHIGAGSVVAAGATVLMTSEIMYWLRGCLREDRATINIR